MEKVVPDRVEESLVVVVGSSSDICSLGGVLGGHGRGRADMLGDGLSGVLGVGYVNGGRGVDGDGRGDGLVFCKHVQSDIGMRDGTELRTLLLTILGDRLGLDRAAHVVDILLAGQEVERVPILFVVALPGEDAREQGLALDQVSRDGSALYRGGSQGQEGDERRLREEHREEVED